ncbi:50S ribosomal protein L9 [Rubritalea marina]|uniref:50S ribosomal protein L9 n=1 Tax=Rubritalea marina TaxID=361055 RepID=UPI000361B618|nr:50S ribosomal protein L9 [Rubritalea marina]
MATTEVILRTKIDNLGAEADVVKVKAGFARNFLIPQGKAYEATAQNLQHTEDLKKARAEREAAELSEAQDLAAKIKKAQLTFTLELGQNGKAFGSVTSIDIQKKLEEEGIVLDRKAIQLDSPIKTSGASKVEIKLLTDVTATLNITVAAPAEEVADA